MAFNFDRFKDNPKWYTYETEGDSLEMEISGEFLTAEVMAAGSILRKLSNDELSEYDKLKAEMKQAFELIPKALAEAIKQWREPGGASVDVLPTEETFASFTRTSQMNLFTFVIECVMPKKQDSTAKI